MYTKKSTFIMLIIYSAITIGSSNNNTILTAEFKKLQEEHSRSQKEINQNIANMNNRLQQLQLNVYPQVNGWSIVNNVVTSACLFGMGYGVYYIHTKHTGKNPVTLW